MSMATWSTAGTVYRVTHEQKKLLDEAYSEFCDGCDKVAESLKDDPRFDGKHIGNPPNPYKSVTERYKAKFKEIVGDNPEIVDPEEDVLI